MALAHDITKQLRTDDIKNNENADYTALFLSERTLSGLQKSGFRKPSPIQQQAIPIGKCGFDLVIRSKSGTGKTAVFAVIALEMIDLSRNCIQCIIIAPTREIAVQIQGVIETIGSDYAGLKVHSFIGGMPVADDAINLQNCHIAVGAPGRLKHLIESDVLKTNSVKLLVLDEADKLMESSFHDDINFVYYKLPKCFQMIASSATYPNHLDQYISRYMHTPTHIDALNAETPLLLGLRQFIATVRQTANSTLEKNRLLLKLLSSVTFTQCIVFSNYQTRAESVSNVLNAEGFSSAYISAAQTQPERLAALAKLKSFQCRIILSTDLTARGIDATNVDLVVNYDVPNDVCTYLHRMGRAGRYGSRGICVTLAENGKDLQNFKKIIGFLGGANMSIAKLSNTSDWLVDDLWKADLLKFEQICGVITPISNYDDIQKSLLELRQYRTTDCIKSDNSVKSDSSEIKSQPKDGPNLKHECDYSTTNVSQTVKYSIAEIYEFRVDPDKQHKNGSFSKLCDVLEPLLESSNLNEDNVSSILRRNCKLRIKYSGLKGTKEMVPVQLTEDCQQNVQEGNDSSSKRKRISTDNSPSNGLMPKEKRNVAESSIIENPECIFQKNIGVLNVTRLLCDESTEVSADISENIGLFLNQLKGISVVKTAGTEEAVPKSTEKLVDQTNNSKAGVSSSNNDPSGYEQLFQCAFDYAIDGNKAHWLEQLSENFNEEAFDASSHQHDEDIYIEGCSQEPNFETMEYDDDDDDYNENEALDENYGQNNLYVSFKDGLKQNEDPKESSEETENSTNKSCVIDTLDYSYISNEASTSHQKTNDIPTDAPRTRSRKINRLLQEVANDKSARSILQESKFNRTFMECGDNFLGTYKNYEEFVKFKSYWGTWKANMETVRQYAQHKIYTQEMLFNEKFNNRFNADDSD